MAKTKKLTKLEQAFVDAYISHPQLNGADSIRQAGYKTKYPDRMASEMLLKPHISAAIAKAMNKRAARVEIKADDVLRYLDDVLHTATTDIVYVATKQGKREDGSEYEYQAVEIRDTDTLTAAQKAAIASIKQTKDGIEVKLHDKTKIAELAMRHLGMLTDKVEVKSEVINRHEYHIEQVIRSDPESAELLKRLYKRTAIPSVGDPSQA